MEPLSEDEILAAFEGQDQQVVLPDLESIDWEVRDYLGWIHPGGHLGYMVVISPNDGHVKGTILQRNSFNGRRPGFEMCSLCHHVHKPHGTAMFTLTRKGSGSRHYIGNIVCKNLDCSLRIRNLVEPSSYLTETLYVEAKIWRMQIALHKWLSHANRL